MCRTADEGAPDKTRDGDSGCLTRGCKWCLFAAGVQCVRICLESVLDTDASLYRRGRRDAHIILLFLFQPTPSGRGGRGQGRVDDEDEGEVLHVCVAVCLCPMWGLVYWTRLLAGRF